ncbi:MAG: hypothetical protein GXP48_03850 [Acidobacteria bacterium]|nr:hypothetical protein [Acidobacteriota bacterium]
MRSEWQIAALWVGTVLVSSLSWLMGWHPVLVPAAAALAVLIEAPWRILGRHAVARALVMSLSAAVYLVAAGGWRIAGAWLVLGIATGAAGFYLGGGKRPRPDFGDLLMMLGWGGAFVIFPHALAGGEGGWLAPLVLLLGARRLGSLAALQPVSGAFRPVPATRETRGDLFVEGVVLAGQDGLRMSLPLELVAEPGESVSILCDDPVEAGILAMTLAGRRSPIEGNVLAGGQPVQASPGAVAVVAPGETFVPCGLDENVAALSSGPLSPGERAAVEEACALEEVRRQLEGRALAADGEPLSLFHRMLVLAARVIPSHYRIVIVQDPQPWLNTIRGEIWRSAVVRASVGRTSIWITPDRDLAGRAGRQLLWSHGTLRPVEGRQWVIFLEAPRPQWYGKSPRGT